ncbi:MAG TPA: alpha/beta hydrolase [Methylomirabilota bacterium]|jgi:pimeloyl-ACP methyl ester carboxylesterase|nr:alpha/beta hydrolase [Methylomirabilota bacterium]
MAQAPRYGHATRPVEFGDLPPGARHQVERVVAADDVPSRGILYWQGPAVPPTAVYLMHPRSDFSQHYAIPALLEHGYAAFGHASRWVNNDTAMIHEVVLLEIAAGLRLLREKHGVRHVVFLGNSGGGSLFAYYQAQAATSPPARVRETPAGDPLDLNAHDLPPADGFVSLAAHVGQGKFLLRAIDPSVVDEGDALAGDPTLDMYNPANGFRLPPAPSRYRPEFVERYRAAQRARVARLDARARQHVAQERYFRARLAEADPARLSIEERIFLQRRASLDAIMVIYRTTAELAYLDLTLEPNDRRPGDLYSDRPDLANYGSPFAFGRLATPRAWLSTWSGLSSRAALLDNLPRVDLPTLVVAYSGDNAVFLSDAEAQFQVSPAADKTLSVVDGADHYGLPLTGVTKDTRAEVFALLTAWFRARFPAA